MANRTKAIQTIFRTLLDAGFECYLVGGSVRDRLLNRPAGDLDFATNARPDDVLRLFRRSHYPNRFGTVLVLLGGVQYEITSYRGEGRYSDHRHPDTIQFVDRLEEDLQRRDFTINAMAMDLNGVIIDPLGGREDLAHRLIRAVGDPAERLAEDPLRMMRAARLATELSFTIEEQTWRAIADNAEMLSIIAQERLRDELLKILASEHPVTGIDFLDHLQLLPYVLPELADAQRRNTAPNVGPDLFQHALQSVFLCRGDAFLRLLALIHCLAGDCGFAGELDFWAANARQVEQSLKRLRLSGVDVERGRRLTLGLASVPDDLPADERSARRLLNIFGNLLPSLLALAEAHRLALGKSRVAGGVAAFRKIDRLAKSAQREGQPTSLSDLAVGGSDLMEALDLQQGVTVGRLLAYLMDVVLDNPQLNQRDRLLDLARARLSNGLEEIGQIPVRAPESSGSADATRNARTRRNVRAEKESRELAPPAVLPFPARPDSPMPEGEA